MIKRRQFPQFLAPYCIAFEKSVGAIVFRITHGKIEFLLMKYRNGHWEFPRGKVEDNESEQETMKREIEEETGISHVRVINSFREYMKFSYKARGQELIDRKKDKSCIYIYKKAIFYLVEAMDEDVVISHEHQKFQWLKFEDGLNKLTFKNARNILIEANKELEDNKVIK
ncbi:MAG: bis(5'-nucleosyl)-tetraphosphatase [Candidatus Moraniibacteriota bacterium]|jgi:bis(5'-nucleosidyl)-tetraphosphatase